MGSSWYGIADIDPKCSMAAWQHLRPEKYQTRRSHDRGWYLCVTWIGLFYLLLNLTFFGT